MIENNEGVIEMPLGVGKRSIWRGKVTSLAVENRYEPGMPPLTVFSIEMFDAEEVAAYET